MNEQNQEPKKERDYVASLERGMDRVANADISFVDKILGKHKNLVFLTSMFIAILVLMEYYFVAKFVIVSMLVLIVVHTVTRVQVARNVTNKGLNVGVDLAKKGSDKVASMMKKKEAVKEEPIQSAPVESPKQ